MAEHTGPTIVIVGGVAGGASAATRARRCNEDARIIIYEKDGYASFANCGLPYYIGGEIEDREKLLVAKPALFKNRFDIELNTRHEVTGIDAKAKSVSVINHESGETLTQSYDKLILAMGAAPIVPPIDGVDSDNVFTLRNLEDTDGITDYLQSGAVNHATVIGAGFIGLEMVEQLHNKGIAVSLVELQKQVLPPMDPEMAKPIAEEVASKGVALHLGDGIAGFETKGGKVKAVVLNSGTKIDTNLVILGIGVRPNTQLAVAIGLELGETGGITINEFAQTSNPDIYAAGDAVEYEHRVIGQKMRIPLAGPANRAGRIAGQHAATGEASAIPPVLGTAIVRVFGKGAASTGLSMKLAERYGIPAKATVISANHHAGYFPGAKPMMLKLIYAPDSGKVLGAQAVGAAGIDKRIDIIATMIQMGGTVRDLTALDLSYAPPYGSAKDAVHMAAFTACNDLDGLTPTVAMDADLDGLQVVDVRTDAEVAKMSLPGAIHIPVDVLRDRIGELDPSKETVVTCQSGLRAHVAVRILKQKGFANVHNLVGGMMMRRLVDPDGVEYK